LYQGELYQGELHQSELYQSELYQSELYQLAAIIPALAILLMALATMLPLPHELSTLLVFLPLTAIYYWSTYTPRLMNMPITLLLALVCDFVTSSPTGIYMLLFFTTQAMVEQQRGFLAAGSFMTLWIGFATSLVVAVGLANLVMGLKTGIFLPLKASIYPLLAVVAMFPIWASMFTLILKALPEEGNLNESR